MGFGKSETPADRSCRLQDHVDIPEVLVLGLELDDITLVMHDFGGPAGMGLFPPRDRDPAHSETTTRWAMTDVILRRSPEAVLPPGKDPDRYGNQPRSSQT